ncbi:MAG: cation-translocating P-type ATPase [Oscillospiraceae bacterium]|jgi:Ca2+-transporting ATPase|nr:cation-translocating P-type ATPase [Oscillospiraceae bacterium]
MDFYLKTAQTVFSEVKSTAEGLSAEEAEARLAANGKNKLKEAEKDSAIKRFFNQMKDPMIVILLVAAAISAGLVIYNNLSGLHEKEFPTDVIIILAVVVINAILGVYQESKAEKAIEALQEMSAATTKTLRDGKIVNVKSEDLVVGDVIILEAGDAVPADCRIFECTSMKIEEAALTGESFPVTKMVESLGDKKQVPLGDRKNMAYMGSVVVFGRGKAVVVGTGMDTEMGKIADAIAQAEEGLTPLQIKLSQLSRALTKIVIGVCVFIFAFNVFMAWRGGTLIHDGVFDFSIFIDSFMVAVSLAVAAIPEGLVAVVTIVLSVGVTNMSRKHAIIRKLTAVETLGCAQIICSDKTGTLTQNVMTVVDHYGTDEGKLATAMALCSDARIDETGAVVGEPTEAALVAYAKKLSLLKGDLEATCPRLGEAPFDSGRKMMSTVHRFAENGNVIQFTKGAPDEILKKCVSAEINGKVVPLTDEIRAQILAAQKAMGGRALRVLAASFKTLSAVPASFEPADLENGLTFIGMTGMIDPVRPEVKDAIVECRGAGITPIMITGDHRETAIAIAKELDIIQDETGALTGAELEHLTDEEFEKRVTNVFVYARVQPEHKTRIVTAWKKKGYVTAMTGDGVNDAPSIKNADIGIGMGITGTDVTKNVADMVLADDNFATIVSAVSEGRRIYDNIRKAIQFLLGSNLSEVLSIFFATMMDFVILKPVHLLWINLVTDSFPALALGMEKPEHNIMRRQPRGANDGVFSNGLGIDVLYQGILVTVLTVFAFYIGEAVEIRDALLAAGTAFSWPEFWAHFKWFGIAESNEGMTMAFLTMSMCEIFHSFNMRSQRGSVVVMGVKGSHNKYLYFAMLASLVSTTLVIEVPFIAEAFGFTPINWMEYFVSLGLAVLVIPIVEFIKTFQRAHAKRKARA